jgi:hypothetical protein
MILRLQVVRVFLRLLLLFDSRLVVLFLSSISASEGGNATTIRQEEFSIHKVVRGVTHKDIGDGVEALPITSR